MGLRAVRTMMSTVLSVGVGLVKWACKGFPQRPAYVMGNHACPILWWDLEMDTTLLQKQML